MNGWLPGMEGEQRSRDLSQFYTPPDLALRMWRWASEGLHPGFSTVGEGRKVLRVLEPAVGRGALILPIPTLMVERDWVVQCVHGFDLDPDNVHHCREQWDAFSFELGDFMLVPDSDRSRYDVSVFNPPYEKYNQGADFAEAVCRCCDLAIALLPARVEHSDGRREFWRWHDMRRKAVLCERPQFGGDYSAMTDFAVYDLVRRQHSRKQGEPTASVIEYW